MKRPIPLKIAKALVKLSNGATITASSAKHPFITLLIKEGLIFSKGKHKKTLQLKNKSELADFIENQLQISDLKNYVNLLEKTTQSRSDIVKVTTNSKTKKARTFKGFLVNCYLPINATLNGKSICLNPPKGSYIFISDYESFVIPEEITVVGMENAENFNKIRNQQYLFKNITPLFISRYPQNQNNDFIQWMKQIPNNYLHFGDFDFAGIGIYLNEYKKHLGVKSNFLIPNNVKDDIEKNGNRDRYNNQSICFDVDCFEESKLKELVDILKQIQKGLDQEFYIK